MPLENPAPATRTSEVRWLVAGVWTIAFFAMVMLAFLAKSEAPVSGYLRAGLMGLAGAALSAVLWRTGRAGSTTTRRVALLWFGTLLAIAIHAGLDLASGRFLQTLLQEQEPVIRIISDNPLRAFLMSVLVESNLGVFAVAHAFFGMAALALIGAVDARERDRQLSEAQAAATSAQLTALRYQLNPHFLFNTLNAVNSLIECGRADEASVTIDRLADFLRSTLSAIPSVTTTLDEELATVEDYLAIEAVRFGDRLRAEYGCPGEVRGARVPSFLLQPLVENAVRYGVSPALRPITIEIGAERLGNRLRIWVENGLDSDSASPSGNTGVGLRNTQERLNLAYGDAAAMSVERAPDRFRVELTCPFLV